MNSLNKQVDFKHKIIDKRLCSVSVEVEVSESVVADEVNSVFSQIQRQAKIDGFRQGKIPRNIIEEKFIEESRSKAIRNVINKTISSILEEEKFDILSFPMVDEFNYDFGKDLKYRFTVECHPKIDITDYKNIPIKKEVFEITDESLDKSIDALREKNAKLIPSKSNKVGENSFVFIDCDAFDSGGKILPEVATKSYMLDLNSEDTRGEFKRALVSLKIGDERNVKIEYQMDYPNKNLADKIVTFKIKVVEIKEKELPEINDDFAKDLGAEDVKDLRIKVRKSMESAEKNRQNMDVERQIIEYLLGSNKFEVPQSLIASQERSLLEKMKRYLEGRGISKEYIQKRIKLESIKFKEEAEKNIRLSYILNAIYKNEGLIVTDSDFEIEKNKIKILNSGRETIIDKFFLESRKNILFSLKERKLFDFLISDAKIEIIEGRIPSS
ncbi:MAG: trigger factor [Endomicrobium sp.]|nr:trigger factor [Endomicrobium sp.]